MIAQGHVSLLCRAPEATDNSTQQLVTATLYAAQSSEEQLQAFKPAAPGTRKVTSSTLLRMRCLPVMLVSVLAEVSCGTKQHLQGDADLARSLPHNLTASVASGDPCCAQTPHLE